MFVKRLVVAVSTLAAFSLLGGTIPDLVFIGTGETCIRGNILPGDGVYRSRDAGATWEHVGFGDSHGISKIRIHPTNPDIVCVASFGRYSVPSEERGVFRSTDGVQVFFQVPPDWGSRLGAARIDTEPRLAASSPELFFEAPANISVLSYETNQGFLGIQREPLPGIRQIEVVLNFFEELTQRVPTER